MGDGVCDRFFCPFFADVGSCECRKVRSLFFGFSERIQTQTEWRCL